MKTLLPHQNETASFLASRRFAGCFSGMGSGKTISSLEAMKRSDANRHLIIGPPISLPMWQREAEEWLQTSAQILTTGKTPIDPTADVLVVSYEIATKRKDELRAWCEAACSTLTADEAHALKNPSAKRTKALLGRGGICETASYTWLLTGTPITRHNDDLIPFMFRAKPRAIVEKIGGLNMDRFKLRYCVVQSRKFPGARYPVKQVVASRNTDELKDMIYRTEPVAIRHELEEVWKNMPPLTLNRYTIPLDRAAMAQEALETLKQAQKASVSDLQRQLQSSEPALATLRREIGAGKVKAAAAEILERVESGQPVLVGAWHTNVIDRLTETLRGKGVRVEVIDGRVSGPRKSAVEAAWNAGDLDVVVGQIGAMGVSLNLQKGGNVIVVVEEDWSPAIMDQFFARLHRMGQEKPVHVDVLQSDTKLDEAVQKLSARKASNMDRLNS